jgi:hypothetical protein
MRDLGGQVVSKTRVFNAQYKKHSTSNIILLTTEWRSYFDLPQKYNNNHRWYCVICVPPVQDEKTVNRLHNLILSKQMYFYPGFYNADLVPGSI